MLLVNYQISRSMKDQASELNEGLPSLLMAACLVECLNDQRPIRQGEDGRTKKTVKER